MRFTWDEFKTFVDTWKVKKLIRHIPKANDIYPLIWLNFEGQVFELQNLKDPAQVAEFESLYIPSTVEPQNEIPVKFSQETNDRRGIIAINRIPAGHTVYPSGAGDHVVNNTYGNGDPLILDGNTLTREFQLLNHYYAFGGRAIWEGCSLDTYVDAWLVAPASTGWVQATGDFTKQAVIPGVLNKLKPVTAGTGDWNVNLAAKLGSTSILASTPVPTPGNLGWFDYDSDTNVLTPNLTQTGGYDLYDQEIKLFKFANRCHGRKLDGAESALESSDVVGKLLYNSWKIRFTLTKGANDTNARVGIVIMTGAMKNV